MDPTRRALLARLSALSLIGAMSAGITQRQPLTRDEWRREELRTAQARAATRGVPLLVIVIPNDDSRRWVLQQAWGQAITHGSNKAISALSACELACAREADLAVVLGNYAPQSPEPTAVRVETSGKWSAHRVTLPEPETTKDGSWQSHTAIEEQNITARIKAMEAFILSIAPPRPAARGRDLDAVRKDPIAGSRWMNSGGCGSDPETADPLARSAMDDMLLVSCGMGHVSERSARFIDFLVNEPAP